MANTNRTGWLFPDMSARADLTQVKAWGDKVGDEIGAPSCTSTTRPATGNYEGRLAWETDTKSLIRYSAGAWIYVAVDYTVGTELSWFGGTPPANQPIRTRTFNHVATVLGGSTVEVPMAFPNGVLTATAIPGDGSANFGQPRLLSATATKITFVIKTITGGDIPPGNAIRITGAAYGW